MKTLAHVSLITHKWNFTNIPFTARMHAADRKIGECVSRGKVSKLVVVIELEEIK